MRQKIRKRKELRFRCFTAIQMQPGSVDDRTVFLPEIPAAICVGHGGRIGYQEFRVVRHVVRMRYRRFLAKNNCIIGKPVGTSVVSHNFSFRFFISV